MKKKASISTMLLAVLSLGCASAQTEKWQHGNVLELTLHNISDTETIVLNSRGVSRVDIQDKVGGLRRSYVLPTNPAEVERVTQDVAVMLESRAERDPIVWPYYVGPKKITIRCRGRKRGETAKLESPMLIHDLAVKGLVQEIETVGMLELARALDWRYTAETCLKEGDTSTAIRVYQEAISVFREWADVRCGRYGAGIFKPEVGMEFRYQGSDGNWITVRGGWCQKVMELSGITPEWAIKALQHGWGVYARGVQVERAEGATIVAFTPEAGSIKWTWGVSRPVVPPELVQAVMVKADPDGAQR